MDLPGRTPHQTTKCRLPAGFCKDIWLRHQKIAILAPLGRLESLAALGVWGSSQRAIIDPSPSRFSNLYHLFIRDRYIVTSETGINPAIQLQLGTACRKSVLEVSIASGRQTLHTSHPSWKRGMISHASEPLPQPPLPSKLACP